MDSDTIKLYHSYGKQLRKDIENGVFKSEHQQQKLTNITIAIDELVAEVKQLQQTNTYWRAGHNWAYDTIHASWEVLGMEPGRDLAAEIKRRLPDVKEESK
jgi:hypothetical protein